MRFRNLMALATVLGLWGVVASSATPHVSHAAVAQSSTTWMLVSAVCGSGGVQTGQACWYANGHASEWPAVSEGSATNTCSSCGYMASYTYAVPATLGTGEADQLTLSAMIGGVSNGGAHARICVVLPFPKQESGEPCATTMQVPNGGSNSASATLTMVPSTATAGSEVTLTIKFEDGSTIDFTYRAASTPTASPTVHYGGAGKVEVEIGGGYWQTGGSHELKVGDRIRTGWRSSAGLSFPDGSTLFLTPMSLCTIVQLEQDASGAWHTVVQCLGEVTAQIVHAPASRGDFQVRTPTTTASVRGTKFSVFYDGATTIVSVQTDAVAVTPDHGTTVVVPAGREVASSAQSVGPMSAIGMAGAPPGSVGPAKALSLLTSALSRGFSACKVSTFGLSLKPRAHGWQASAKIAGARSGIASWTITRTKVTPANQLARSISAGCH